jgi:DNA-binding response OmpR family regulator
MAVAAPARTNGSTPSDTVLVVDEDATVRGHLSDVLGSAGYATLEAASGCEALATARLTPPSAVVLDVTLPGMTGYDVCRTLRDEYGEELPIIFVSGDRTEPLDRVAGLMMGADDYVVEPFAPAELVARIRRALSRVKFVRRSLA